MAKSERSETKLFDGIRLFSIRLYRLAGEFDMCAQVLVSYSHIYGCNQSHPMTHLHLYTVRCTVQELKLWCWIFLFFLCCCLTIAYLSNCFHLFFFLLVNNKVRDFDWKFLKCTTPFNSGYCFAYVLCAVFPFTFSAWITLNGEECAHTIFISFDYECIRFMHNEENKTKIQEKISKKEEKQQNLKCLSSQIDLVLS